MEEVSLNTPRGPYPGPISQSEGYSVQSFMLWCQAGCLWLKMPSWGESDRSALPSQGGCRMSPKSCTNGHSGVEGQWGQWSGAGAGVCHSSLWDRANLLPSQGLSSLSCKMGIVLVLTVKGGCENEWGGTHRAWYTVSPKQWYYWYYYYCYNGHE